MGIYKYNAAQGSLGEVGGDKKKRFKIVLEHCCPTDIQCKLYV